MERLPVQMPCQPTNTNPRPGTAISLNLAPAATATVQAGPQAPFPPSTETAPPLSALTATVPRPEVRTVRRTVVGVVTVGVDRVAHAALTAAAAFTTSPDATSRP